jgi:hypothetical protein
MPSRSKKETFCGENKITGAHLRLYLTCVCFYRSCLTGWWRLPERSDTMNAQGRVPGRTGFESRLGGECCPEGRRKMGWARMSPSPLRSSLTCGRPVSHASAVAGSRTCAPRAAGYRCSPGCKVEATNSPPADLPTQVPGNGRSHRVGPCAASSFCPCDKCEERRHLAVAASTTARRSN